MSEGAGAGGSEAEREIGRKVAGGGEKERREKSVTGLFAVSADSSVFVTGR